MSDSIFKSLLRLTIGGALVGYDELVNRTKKWESQATEVTREELIIPPDPSETPRDHARYLVVGAMIETQERIGAGIGSLGKYTTAASQLISPFLKPVTTSRFVQPINHTLDRWAERGQSEVDRLITRGRTEEEISRELAEAAFFETVDTSIEYLASNQELQDLVATQGVSLAGGMVEEVRERSVSADSFLEGVVRLFMRRPPRAELPPPSPEIMAQAAPLQALREENLRRARQNEQES